MRFTFRSPLIIAAFAAIVFAACSSPEQKKVEVEYKTHIYGLATPIQLSLDSTEVHLEDYVDNSKGIERVSMDGVDYEVYGSGQIMVKQAPKSPITNLHVVVQGVEHDIPVFASEKVRYTFQYTPKNKTVKVVELAGNMNGWNRKANPLIKQGDVWSTELVLNPGLYQYRPWEDGKEVMDPNNPNTIDNGQGGLNNTFSVGDTRPAPQLLTASATETSFDVISADTIADVFAYFQNTRIPVKGGNGQWTIAIPQEAKNLDRSFIRVYAHNGRSRSNDVLVPLTHGDVVMNATSLDRKDLQNTVMYFTMVDRFADGEPGNNRPTNDPEISPKANNMGGDLKGIIQKINDGYFKKMGITTIWISPISRNAEGAWGLWDKGVRSKFSGYHGYWPTALTSIDDRFGTDAEFKELINVAHENGMNVLLDYVAHHVHQDHPLYKQKPEWTTPLYLPDGTMNTEKWDEHRLTTWFDTFMPTWDFSKQEVVDALTDSAMFWVKNYDLDGFRHDATKHISESFWKRLTYKLKEQLAQQPDRRVFQIGETYGNPELIGSYINSGQLDAQFDFNLYDAAVDAFAKGNTNFENLRRVLTQSIHAYGSHHLMGNITGNQDRCRFASYADGSVAFSEDAKLAGWTRDIQNKGAEGFARMAQLAAFINTVPGIPCIYYGDEIAMPGGNDPDNRRMMTFSGWNKEQADLQATFTRLIQLRTSHLELSYGDLVFLGGDNNTLAFARTYFGKTAIVIFNKQASGEISLALPSVLKVDGMKAFNGSTFSIANGELKMQWAGKGFEILYVD